MAIEIAVPRLMRALQVTLDICSFVENLCPAASLLSRACNMPSTNCGFHVPLLTRMAWCRLTRPTGPTGRTPHLLNLACLALPRDLGAQRTQRSYMYCIW